MEQTLLFRMAEDQVGELRRAPHVVKEPRGRQFGIPLVGGGEVKLGSVAGAKAHGTTKPRMGDYGPQRFRNLVIVKVKLFADRERSQVMAETGGEERQSKFEYIRPPDPSPGDQPLTG